MALWRDIAGYDGLYQVSSDGRVKSLPHFDFDGTLLAAYSSIVIAAQMTCISRTAINNSLCGWSKSAGGYIWKYEMEE